MKKFKFIAHISEFSILTSQKILFQGYNDGSVLHIQRPYFDGLLRGGATNSLHN